ncbi:MAG: DUF2087 domain-containing protein [Clostridiales bacterium]|nr:DUF2087 domain-containing protein [Candidatus Apopatocola equi]
MIQKAPGRQRVAVFPELYYSVFRFLLNISRVGISLQSAGDHNGDELGISSFGNIQSVEAVLIAVRILKSLMQEDMYVELLAEREVNLIIADYHDDFCSIRRNMIAEHILSRENMIYRKA